ncbi:hypothetical protein HZA97_04700 [Candidatus Woesearchaeota archaeon]|nr:hypothetical protein [Candidatus Woesearchaeota archaeon]
MSTASSVKGFFVFSVLEAAASFYFLEYSSDLFAAFVSVSFLGLLVSATFAKLVRAKVAMSNKRYLKKKFFKIKKLEDFEVEKY